MTPTTEPAANRPPGDSAQIPQLQMAPQPKCSCKGLLRPRRMHALAGLWMTGFLFAHLAIVVTGWSPAAYGRNASFIQGTLAGLPAFTMVAIFLPLLFQTVSGLYLLRKEGMRYNVKKCNRGGKVRFFLQRVTGLVILAFGLFHLGTIHEWGLHTVYRATHLGALSGYSAGGLFQAGAPFRSTAQAFGRFCGTSATGNLLVAAFLLLGIWAAVFHTANGAWTGAGIWNLIPTPESKRRWRFVCIAIGTVLFVAGTVAWSAFTLRPHAKTTSQLRLDGVVPLRQGFMTLQS